MRSARNNIVYVSIDIGTDTTKSAFSYVDERGRYRCELAYENSSIAYYDVSAADWKFDEGDIYESARNSFQYIVKIRDLLDLFHDDKKSHLYNGDSKRFFKNFYFPPLGKEVSYDEMIKNKQVFKADQTPREVCKLFVAFFIERVREVLVREFGPSIRAEYIVVYPAHSAVPYIKELRALVANAIDVSDSKVKVFSAPKSVGVAAKEYGILDGIRAEEKNVLIFNLGESNLSVVKARFKDNSILMDGVEGHNEPMELGGHDFDLIINSMLSDKSSAILSPGQESGKGERGTYYDQFRMQRDIKYGKMMFGDGESYARMNYHVIFTVFREMDTNVYMEKEEFAEACQGTFASVWSYVKRELERSTNKDVQAIIFSGGAADTFGLDKYIQKEMEAQFPKVSYLDFSPEDEEKGYDNILCEAKDTVPIGAALFAAGKYNFEIVTTRAYGTYMNGDSFAEIIHNGTCIPISGELEKEHFSSSEYAIGGAVQVDKSGDFFLYNEYYKCDAPRRYDVIKFSNYHYLQEDVKPGAVSTKKFKAQVDGKSMLDIDVIGYYKMYFRTSEITSVDVIKKLRIKEGFKIDCEGRALPVVRNVTRMGLDYNSQALCRVKIELLPNGEGTMRISE